MVRGPLRTVGHQFMLLQKMQGLPRNGLGRFDNDRPPIHHFLNQIHQVRKMRTAQHKIIGTCGKQWLNPCTDDALRLGA